MHKMYRRKILNTTVFSEKFGETTKSRDDHVFIWLHKSSIHNSGNTLIKLWRNSGVSLDTSHGLLH